MKGADREEETPKVKVIKVRKNGCEAPCQPLQIAAYVVFFYQLISYYLFNMTSLAERPAVLGTCSVVYGIFATLSIYYGYKGTHSDPTDPIIY
jgi:hypothetical protein